MTDVARGPYGNVELAVGTETDELPSVRSVRRETDAQRRGGGGIRKAVFDVVEAEEAAHLGDEERAVPEGDAVGHGEPFRDRVNPVGPVIPILVPSAYTFPAYLLPTKRVPLGLKEKERALGTPSAKSEIEKPRGSLIVCRGSSRPAAAIGGKTNARKKISRIRDFAFMNTTISS